MWEQQFSLVYNSNGGITYGDVLQMERAERDWFITRLNDQIQKENDEMKKASKGKSNGPKLPTSRRRR